MFERVGVQVVHGKVVGDDQDHVGRPSLVFLGRLLRFGIEAVLALYFGRQVLAFMNSDVVTYIVYGLIGIAVILSTLSLLRWLKRK